MRWMSFLLLFLILTGCSDKSGNIAQKSEDGNPVAFEVGKVVCPQCHMDLKSLKDSVEVIKDKEVTIFDDIGCMVLWMNKQGINPNDVKIWVFSRDTKHWIDAKKAYYSLTDTTPMGYGFGAYENRKKDMIGFDEMYMNMLRGLTLKDPRIRKKLLGY
jgi:nitrous oxide reductase accessory protein NosL